MARIILRDGQVAELRRAENTPADFQLVNDLFHHASPDSLYFRFFHTVKEVSASTIEGMLGGNGVDYISFLCLAGNRALGIGTYVRVDEETAEVAFLVDDESQGKGFGTLLLENLAQEAWHHGFKQFEAYVLDGNTKMLHVFRASGYELRQTTKTGTMHLVLPLTETERTHSLRDTREKLATVASLTPYFAPASVAVIGASRDVHGLGHLVFRNIVNSEFQGTVYPVNPNAKTVASIHAYRSVLDLPEPIDLAVIVVPASEVPDVVDECIRANVKAVMILSAGFAERGEQGAKLQQDVLQRLRDSGRRLIGPNSLGLINTVPEVHLNASFVRELPSTQGVSIASQSGALGIAILEYANRMGVGVTHFVSIGNKADVSSNDLLQFWEDDPSTKLIALYIESFGNPRKFSRLARRITRKKPILVVKGAHSPIVRTLSGLTASPSQTPETVVDALFQQTGVIRLDTLQDMFDVAALISNSPLPQGRRVAIVTNSSGGAVITADALIKEGLTFVDPVVDLGFDALADGYRNVLPKVLQDEKVDAVVILFVPVGVSDEDAIVQAIAEAIDNVRATSDTQTPVVEKPIVANFLASGDYAVRYIETKTRRVPVYPFPEQAVRALGKVAAYADYLSRNHGQMPDLENVDSDLARSLVRQHRSLKSFPIPVCQDILAAMGVSNLWNVMAHETLTFHGRIDIASDTLFGPVLRVSRLHRGISASSSPAWESTVRIIPLTNVDASEVAETVVDWGVHLNSNHVTAFVDLLLRVSRIVEDVPDIQTMSLLYGVGQDDDIVVHPVEIVIEDID